MERIVEICTENYESINNAIESDAQRIELCSALEIGGLTPSYAFVEKACKNKKIAVNVLLRPRPGNFVYSNEEFDIMCQDILHLKKINIDGIVSGVLTEDGEVDIERTKTLVELSRPLSFTFHRAFDNCKNISEAIKQVISTGADRLLTSGGKPNVTIGMQTILELHNNYGNDIIIMPGSGVNAENAEIFAQNGLREIHLSAGAFVNDNTHVNPELNGMGYSYENNRIGVKISDSEKIKQVCEVFKRTL